MTSTKLLLVADDGMSVRYVHYCANTPCVTCCF